MTDESFIDVNSVLDRPEKWARESLHDDGFSEAFIDAWIQIDDGWDFEDALDLIMAEHDYKFLLIRHIGYIREHLSNGNQSPIDWVWDGFLIAWFHNAGSLSESEKAWFSDLQKKRARKPRNRTNVAIRAVEYILREAPELPGTRKGFERDLKYQVLDHGRDINRFRHHVGEWCRLYGKDIDIDVTAIDNDDGKVIEYDIFDNKTDERNIVKEATIRKIISRINSQPPGKGSADSKAP